MCTIKIYPSRYRASKVKEPYESVVKTKGGYIVVYTSDYKEQLHFRGKDFWRNFSVKNYNDAMAEN